MAQYFQVRRIVIHTQAMGGGISEHGANSAEYFASRRWS